MRDGRGDRFQCSLRTVPAAEWAGLGWVLRSQGSSGKEELWRCAPGGGMIASNACSGPFPLLSGRDWDGSFARREARGRMGFSADAPGVG